MVRAFTFAQRRPTEVTLSDAAAKAIRKARLALGWTQARLAERAQVSRTLISKVECGRRPVSIASIAAIADALGMRVELVLEPAFVTSPRDSQGSRGSLRDVVHARCCVHVQQQLERRGWLVAREVPIDSGGARGWIDLFALHPGSGALLVIEIKTEIHDLGRIERTLSWHERGAIRAARELGWGPGAVSSALLVLDSEAVAETLGAARAIVERAFPVGGGALASWIGDPTRGEPRRRALALIDPAVRGQRWLMAVRSGGRTRPAAYRDYADAAARLTAGRPRPAR